MDDYISRWSKLHIISSDDYYHWKSCGMAWCANPLEKVCGLQWHISTTEPYLQTKTITLFNQYAQVLFYNKFICHKTKEKYTKYISPTTKLDQCCVNSFVSSSFYVYNAGSTYWFIVLVRKSAGCTYISMYKIQLHKPNFFCYFTLLMAARMVKYFQRTETCKQITLCCISTVIRVSIAFMGHVGSRWEKC